MLCTRLSLVLLGAMLLCASNVEAQQSCTPVDDCVVSSKAPMVRVQSLEQLMTNYWDEQLRLMPSLARMHRKATTTEQFTDVSPKGNAAFVELTQRTLEAARTFDPQTLSVVQQQDLATLIWIAEHEQRKSLSPMRYLIFNDVYSWIDLYLLNSSKQIPDLPQYDLALAQMPHLIKQHQALLEQGVASHYTQPERNTRTHIASVGRLLEQDRLQALLLKPYGDKITPQAMKNAKAAQSALADYHHYLSSDYLRAARADISLSTLPQGHQNYADALAYYTSTDLDAEALHNLGLNEVQRLMTEAEHLRQQLLHELHYPSDSVNDLFNRMRQDPELGFNNRDDVLAHGRQLLDVAQKNMGKLFQQAKSNKPLELVPIDSSIEANSAAGFYSFTADKGVLSLNTYAPQKLRRYNLPSLILHEGLPGHHYQVSLKANMPQLSPLRAQYYFHAIGEGWALYTETLYPQLLPDSTPFDALGQLSQNLLRAARVVADTGIHAKHWSRQQALDYLLSHTALTETEASNEVDRYISLPAQAVSYKVGELFIQNMKRHAMARLGKQFDLRGFHQVILENSSLPLTLMPQAVDIWINTTTAL